MPTYEYECDACAHHFEKLQSMTEPKLKECPQCHKETLHRLIGRGSGIIFKGTGFYETDYKKKTGAPDAPTKPKEAPAGTLPAGPCCGGGSCSH